MNDQVMVSVFCLTYNHEKYIEGALEGFVNQKTNFKFEVFVHDDASTDGTAAIIREYEQKYPDLFTVIYQTENQFQKNFHVPRELLVPMARGKYFAWCEGDDYWTDPYKLQKQFDFMESHPEYSLCLHRALKHWCVPGGEDIVGPVQEADRDYSLTEIASREHFFAFASFFIRAHLYRSMPSCFFARTCSDIPLQIYAAICGSVHCLQDVMSVYNYRTENSFTRKFFNDHSRKIDHNRDVISTLKKADEYYNFRYTKELSAAIRYHEYHLYKHTGELDRIAGREYDEVRNRDKKRIARLEELHAADKR